MRLLYVFQTRVGPFYIAEHGGRFSPVYKDAGLGSYARPEQAAEDLAGGHTFTVPGAGDTSQLGIPADLGGWQRLPVGGPS